MPERCEECRALANLVGRSVQVDHLAVHADLAVGVDLDLVVARELHGLGRLELDALGLDLDRLARLELEPRALHLEHRALLGEPDAQLDLARRAADLDELVAAGALHAERAALAQVQLSTLGRFLSLKRQLFLGHGRHGSKVPYATESPARLSPTGARPRLHKRMANTRCYAHAMRRSHVVLLLALAGCPTAGGQYVQGE